MSGLTVRIVFHRVGNPEVVHSPTVNFVSRLLGHEQDMVIDYLRNTHCRRGPVVLRGWYIVPNKVARVQCPACGHFHDEEPRKYENESDWLVVTKEAA